jgi:hypothetical protein
MKRTKQPCSWLTNYIYSEKETKLHKVFVCRIPPPPHLPPLCCNFCFCNREKLNNIGQFRHKICKILPEPSNTAPSCLSTIHCYCLFFITPYRLNNSPRKYDTSHNVRIQYNSLTQIIAS